MKIYTCLKLIKSTRTIYTCLYYLYMSLIDLIYYEYLYMSLIDLIYYLNVNFDSCIITNKLDNINQTINNNLVIVHTKPNLSITIY